MGYRAKAYTVGAKTKAMHGMRITSLEYDEIIKRQSISGVIAYLKTLPNYSQVLSGINEAAAGRSVLEIMLGGSVLADYKKIEYFLSDKDKSVVLTYLQRSEIELIIGVIIGLRNKSDKKENNLPQHIEMNFSDGIAALLSVNSFAELGEGLEKTKYAGVLNSFDLAKSEAIEIEQALSNHFYKSLYKTVNKSYPRREATEIKKHLGMRVDLENIRRFVRMKRFGAEKNTEKYFLDLGYRIKINNINDIANSSKPAELLDKIGTLYGKYYRATDGTVSDASKDEILLKLDKITLRMSKSAAASAIAYIGIKNNEIKNLYHIIESIRYGLPPETIREKIIGYSEESRY